MLYLVTLFISDPSMESSYDSLPLLKHKRFMNLMGAYEGGILVDNQSFSKFFAWGTIGLPYLKMHMPLFSYVIDNKNIHIFFMHLCSLSELFPLLGLS